MLRVEATKQGRTIGATQWELQSLLLLQGSRCHTRASLKATTAFKC